MVFLQAKDGFSTSFQLLQFLQEGLLLKVLNPATEYISSSQGARQGGIPRLQTFCGSAILPLGFGSTYTQSLVTVLLLTVALSKSSGQVP